MNKKKTKAEKYKIYIQAVINGSDEEPIEIKLKSLKEFKLSYSLLANAPMIFKALLEAKQVIESQNNGNCLLSIVDAIEAVKNQNS